MDPDEIDELAEQARRALRDGRDVLAVALTDQLLGAVPDDPHFHVLRAHGLLGSASVQDALSEAQRAVELNQADPHAQRVLGLAAWKSNRLTLAQNALHRAIELSGGDPQLQAEYAWFMANQRGPRLAERAAQQAVESDATSATAWAALGLAQYRLRRRAEAETSLRHALQLDPANCCAQSAMAILLQDQRKDSQAEVLAERLRENPDAAELAASIHQRAKQRQLARMLVERRALPEVPAGVSPRQVAAWLLTVALMITSLCLLVEPEDPRAIILCIAVPLVLAWFLRRLFQ